MSNNLKVSHLSSHHSPTSVRIFKKQCRSLSNAGFDVVYIVPGNGESVIDGVQFDYIKPSKGLLNRLFIKPLKIYLKARNNNSIVYHFHDPELIFFGLLLKLRGKKVIYDIHEDLPAKIESINKPKIKKFLKLVSFVIGKFEKYAVNIFDMNVTVNEEIKLRFNSGNVEIVTNYPIVELFKEVRTQKDVVHNLNGKTFVYTGLLNEIRGIKQIIEALSLIDEDEQVQLILLGSWENESYRNECESLKGWKKTKYKGMLPLEEAYNEIINADFTIINFLPLKNHLNSMPNKAFEYMAAGKPIIMSDFPYWKKLFKECAIFVNPEDPISISKGIETMIKYQSLRNNLGQNAKSMIEEKYSWEAESKKLLKIYSRLVEN